MRSLTQDTFIEPKVKRSLLTDIKELWLFRELFYFFAWRDIKVRYKQTALGAGWAILQPVLATGIFTLFFNRVAKISSGALDIPYPVFAYLGLMYWNAFSTSVNTISNSIVSNSGVITKIYFPRLIPPLSATALSVVDFFFAGTVFLLLLWAYKVVPGIMGVVLVIPSLLLVIMTALGMGTFFAALNVKYRDVRSALPFVTQLLIFVTPVIYPISLIPERYQIYAYLNPVTGAISSVRAGFFNLPIPWKGLLISWTSAVIMLFIGIWYFKRTEKNFVDVI